MKPFAYDVIDRFAPLAPHYDGMLCDIWGVVHNGVTAFGEACDALQRFRRGGGRVVLISNAPRPTANVLRQLDCLEIPRDAYDDVITSGDMTRNAMLERSGQFAFHLGPERDRPLFAGLDIRLAPAEQADYIVCTGLFDDETESPEDYRPLLTDLRARDVFMICANPDLVVDRDDRLIYCAGALAVLYEELGGEVLYAGKPHPPIYEAAFARLNTLAEMELKRERIVAIGDSVRTDLTGAAAVDIDGIFIVGGIHAEELGGLENPDRAIMDRVFAAHGVTPKAVMRRFAW